jgi:hypothetical protein
LRSLIEQVAEAIDKLTGGSEATRTRLDTGRR